MALFDTLVHDGCLFIFSVYDLQITLYRKKKITNDTKGGIAIESHATRNKAGNFLASSFVFILLFLRRKHFIVL